MGSFSIECIIDIACSSSIYNQEFNWWSQHIRFYFPQFSSSFYIVFHLIFSSWLKVTFCYAHCSMFSVIFSIEFLNEICLVDIHFSCLTLQLNMETILLPSISRSINISLRFCASVQLYCNHSTLSIIVNQTYIHTISNCNFSFVFCQLFILCHNRKVFSIWLNAVVSCVWIECPI